MEAVWTVIQLHTIDPNIYILTNNPSTLNNQQAISLIHRNTKTFQVHSPISKQFIRYI